MLECINTIIKNLKNAQDFLEKELKIVLETGSFIEMESKIRDFVNKQVVTPLFSGIITNLYKNIKDYLKGLGKKEGYGKLKTKEKTIKIYTGEQLKINTLYATNDGVGGKKKGTKDMFLEQLGFIDFCSPLLVSDVVSSGLYCPSFEVAKEVLSARGVKIDDNKISSLTNRLGKIGIEKRGEISFEEGETFEGKDIIITIDGGRICTRITKKGDKGKGDKGKGDKGKGDKGKGYNALWKEPKCFAIGELEEGRLSKTKPFYDGTIGGAKEMYEILKKYLIKGEIWNAKRVSVAGDGAQRIWDYIKKLLIELGVEKEKITEILDYFHGVNHISVFTDNIKGDKKKRKKLFNKLKKLLWNGESEEMIKEMGKQTDYKDKKLYNREIKYFDKHKSRTRYSFYRDEHKPCGSGMIESMIRRVVNLRLKGPSIFWKKENANNALFLRSQLLSGRWTTFMNNILYGKLKSTGS